MMMCFVNLVQMFERTINCTIAKDNGRAPEFIRRKEYKDKSKCYECGVSTACNLTNNFNGFVLCQQAMIGFFSPLAFLIIYDLLEHLFSSILSFPVFVCLFLFVCEHRQPKSVCVCVCVL